TNGLCTHLYEQPMKYKVNYTSSCRWHFHTEKVASDVSSAFNILLAEMLLYVFGIANSSGDVIAICKYPAFPTFTTAGQLTQL
ncbi:hypothetical protein WUBG_17417, partial [Wuchereria bancrofti]